LLGRPSNHAAGLTRLRRLTSQRGAEAILWMRPHPTARELLTFISASGGSGDPASYTVPSVMAHHDPPAIRQHQGADGVKVQLLGQRYCLEGLQGFFGILKPVGRP
jgi:hypothetical protein